MILLVRSFFNNTNSQITGMSNTMEDKLKRQKENLAWSKYAVRLNGWRFAGAIEPEGITRAICSAYRTPVKECDYLVKGHAMLPPVGGTKKVERYIVINLMNGNTIIVN